MAVSVLVYIPEGNRVELQPAGRAAENGPELAVQFSQVADILSVTDLYAHGAAY